MSADDRQRAYAVLNGDDMAEVIAASRPEHATPQAQADITDEEYDARVRALAGLNVNEHRTYVEAHTAASGAFAKADQPVKSWIADTEPMADKLRSSAPFPGEGTKT
jgi:hypothetical protein